MPTAAVLPTGAGLAVHAAGRSRILPWDVARQLLDDPGLTIVTESQGELSPWDGERLLCAIAAGDEGAPSVFAGGAPADRHLVRALRRYPRRWARTIDASIIVGDLDGACCRAGLALPMGDALVAAETIARLMERYAGQVAVRQRLLDYHPWIGDAAWLSATGQLAETVVLEGLRRDQVQRAVVPGEVPVSELLSRPERFQATGDDARAAMRSILDGSVRWDDRGRLSLAPAAGGTFTVGSAELALGVGGLHSCDPAGAIDGPLVDLDVASYYPSIIAADAISPPQLPDFSRRVGLLMARRLEAKRARDHTASQALKYVINSLYGQLGNSRSGLFSPPDALRVVLTGQLRLLQLIDGLVASGCELISANTDGVVVRGDAEAGASAWETLTGLTLERTAYRRIWRTSVNDYVAQGPDGEVVKAKGRFAGGDDDAAEASRRSAAPVVARAAVEHLVHQRRMEDVIAGSTVVTDFAMWRRARDLSWGGRAVDERVVRWVVGRGGEPIVQSTGHRETSTVATQAIPVWDPARVDLAVIDRGWYLSEARDLVDRVLGTTHGAKQLSLL